MAWADVEYNQRIHRETGQKPIDRWRALTSPGWVDEEKCKSPYWNKPRQEPKGEATAR